MAHYQQYQPQMPYNTHQQYPQQYNPSSSFYQTPSNQFQQNSLQNSFQYPYDQQNFGQGAYPVISTTEVSTTTMDLSEFDYKELGKCEFYIPI